MKDLFINPFFWIWVIMFVWLSYLHIRYTHKHDVPFLKSVGINGTTIVSIYLFLPIELIIFYAIWPISMFSDDFYTDYNDLIDN